MAAGQALQFVIYKRNDGPKRVAIAVVSTAQQIRDLHSVHDTPHSSDLLGPLVHHAPNLSFLAVSDVERSVRAFRNSVRPRHSIIGIREVLRSFEAACKHLECTGRLAVRKRLEDNIETGLLLGGSIPRAMEGDERAILIARW